MSVWSTKTLNPNVQDEEQVSAAACRSLEQTVPNYSGISMQMMYDETCLNHGNYHKYHYYYLGFPILFCL